MRNALLALVLVVGCSKESQPAAPAPPPAPAGPQTTPTAMSEAEFKALHGLRPDQAPPRAGEMIDLAGGRAYLSLPEGKHAPVPGIIVIHEWWGLNEHIQHWADRLAGLGYATLAVDLYGGKVATTPDEAMAIMKQVDDAQASRTLAAAVQFLADDERVRAPKHGVIGWCFGGAWSLEAALQNPEIDAAVMYYGMPEEDPQRIATLQAELLGIFANRDGHITPAVVDQLEKNLAAAGRKATIERYDADHAFGNPSSDRYDQANAAAAWSEVVAFFERTLAR